MGAVLGSLAPSPRAQRNARYQLTNTPTDRHTHTHKHTQAHTHTHTEVRKHTHTDAHGRTRAHTHATPRHARTHAHMHAHAHMRAHTRTQTHTYKHTYARAHRHTHIPTDTHADTHTHAPALGAWSPPRGQTAARWHRRAGWSPVCAAPRSTATCTYPMIQSLAQRLIRFFRTVHNQSLQECTDHSFIRTI